jgi:sialate O-acetylesterase
LLGQKFGASSVNLELSINFLYFTSGQLPIVFHASAMMAWIGTLIPPTLLNFVPGNSPDRGIFTFAFPSLSSISMNHRLLLVVGAVALFPARLLFGQVQLPALISDHMVLQADAVDPLWGWAPAGTAVKIDFTDGHGKNLAHTEATATANGKWMANLPTLAAGTMGRLRIVAGNDTRTIDDVLVGENWLCTGQSNMGYMVGETNATPQILATAHREATAAHGAIRYFNVIKLGYATPQEDVRGEWVLATPDNVGLCSSVAWNFGVILHDKLHRPVGLIISAMGATPAEAWLPQTVIASLTCGPAIAKREQDRLAKYPNSITEVDKKMADWLKANPTPAAQEANLRKVAREPGTQFTHIPSWFYNGMIHGLEPYRVKGVLWFQGGDNAPHPQEYPELIKALIQTWRKEWGDDFPFYSVELQSENAVQTKPVDESTNIPIMREMQRAALELPKTDLVTSVDLSGAEALVTPHFRNKKPLGLRLANMVLEQVYGLQMGEVHSPMFSSFTIEGDKVRLHFDHAEGLRAKTGGALGGFAIRGGSRPRSGMDGRRIRSCRSKTERDFRCSLSAPTRKRWRENEAFRRCPPCIPGPGLVNFRES